MILRRLLLLVVGLVSPSLSAQTPPRVPAVDEAMSAFVKSNDVAGVVSLVVHRNQVVHLGAVGQRSREENQPMTPDTLFRIASMTKPITAIAIMMLADEGKLTPEDPVEKHLPEFRGQMLVASRDGDSLTLRKPKRPIQLRDLLTHTSGLPGGYPSAFAEVYSNRNWTLKETTLIISQQPLQFEPGTRWNYCNAGIDTLGRVVEVVSGQSFEDFLKTRLFEPLGMTHTTFYPTPEQQRQLAVTYNKMNDQLVPMKNLFLEAVAGAKHPVPAGGLYSTAPDLAKLCLMLLNRGEWGGRRYLSEASFATMTRTQTAELPTGFVKGMSFGYGFAVVKEPTGVTAMLSPGTFGHGGAFGTQYWIDPKKQLAIVLMIQRTGLPNADASPMRQALQEAAVKLVN